MKPKISFTAALIPVITTAFLLILAVLYFHIPLFIPLLAGYLLTSGIALFYHIPVGQLISDSLAGIKSIGMIFLILLLIGSLIAVWSESGTIDALIYYGLAWIQPEYLVVTGFIVSAIVSMILGTSVGTASTIGVAFMGMAHSLGIQPALVAGALVSGAFVGDRTSPLSSSAHLNAVVTETNYYDNVRELVKTLIPAIIMTAVIYFIIGNMTVHFDQQSNILIDRARTDILKIYGTLPLWLLLPPVMIFILAVLKVSIKANLLAGSLFGAVLAYIYQDQALIDILRTALFGFHHSNGSVFGGAWNMFHQVLLIIVVGAFYGILETTGILKIILEQMTTRFSNELSIIKKTMSISISAAMLFSTQIMSIMIPGKVMLPIYKEKDLQPKLLNRMISDSGMVVAGLIPWNLNAILLGIALHISVVDYAPYAFLLWVLPLYSYLEFKWRYLQQEKTTGRNLIKNQEL